MRFYYTLLIGLCFLSATAQTNKELVNLTVKQNTIESQIYFLASDELRGRETGSQEIGIAASYIANTLRGFGVKPVNGSYYQDVPLEKIKAPSKVEVSINGAAHNETIMMTGKNTNLNAELVVLEYGLESEYKGQDVKGKIVVCEVGTAKDKSMRAAYMAKNKKVQLALQHGAIGLIELADFKDNNWKFIKSRVRHDKISLASKESSGSEPHIWLLDQGHKLLNNWKSQNKINASVNIEGSKKIKLNEKNVVGMVEGTDPKLKDEFVIYSAHYDHVGVGAPNKDGDTIYNGARDNAVGVVTVLSTAENIAKYPTKRSALFILFTAEEKGLIGSDYYANNPLIPLNQMVFCFNSDGGGYNDKSKATIVGLERTTADVHIKKAAQTFGLTAIGDPAPEQNLFDRSDNVHFAIKGVPAPTFSPGFTGFDAEIMKYYHQAADNPDSLDYEYLTQFFKAYVMSARLIANDKNKPFWKEGDKYYDAGKALYK